MQNFKDILKKTTRIGTQVLTEAFYNRKFTLPPELKEAYKITKALKYIKQRWPELWNSNNDSEYPVFIFSAGWRSGSTLMQRLVISSGEVAIWGEPFGRAGIIPRLAITLTAFNNGWPPDNFFDEDSDLLNLSNKWIANLTPPINYLKQAHRELIQQWLAIPAKKRFGISRWGFKEVRLTIDHARYLKWLFPNARFIFIYRNLFDAYRSWKGNLWGGIWPGYFSWSPIVFARHWKLLLEGYLQGYKEVDGIMIKFEDLISNKIDLNEIANHIGVKKLDASVLKEKIGGPDKLNKKKRKKFLTPFEYMVLKFIGKPLLKKLGYC
ncbi:MAG: hypothetical protein MW689_001559 [Thermodesulfobacteria bacterium]|nr:sulfotransferase [Thermodesulfobacteriota bacterium]MCU4137988.1 hypothetical protein [Thermodesulfobacteriota bacterium]